MHAHPFTTCELDPETYGAAMLPFIGEFVVGRDEITDEDAQRWIHEQQQLGARGEFYFAITQLCFTATKPPAESSKRHGRTTQHRLRPPTPTWCTTFMDHCPPPTDAVRC